jgi:hypothetical protein
MRLALGNALAPAFLAGLVDPRFVEAPRQQWLYHTNHCSVEVEGQDA